MACLTEEMVALEMSCRAGVSEPTGAEAWGLGVLLAQCPLILQ
jgi:hypothetical protein